MTPAIFVTQIELSLEKKLENDLLSQGFILSQPAYTLFQAKKEGLSCTLYQSGKLVVQGKNKDDFIAFYLEPEILNTLDYTYPKANEPYSPHIGVDEAGKGDVFGPLCIAALYADPDQAASLIKMGVRDSKSLKDPMIIKIAERIKNECQCSIVRMFPSRYNELYLQFRNLNHLLAWGHATAIEELVTKTGCEDVTIDQFASSDVVENAVQKKRISIKLTQRHRDEEDLIVAGASILARASFVQGLELLSKKFEMTLPKGASSGVIQVGQRFVKTYGAENLKEVSKLHFKTTQSFLS